jgi:hypothetical protein
MKLYPLIYTNEGARTPEEALSKGVAAAILEDRIVLFSVDRVLQTTKTFLEKNPKTKQNKSYYSEMLGTELAKRSIVGQVKLGSSGQDLYTVKTSAGVSKFGPLAYQLAMVNIYPDWLMSDTSLTKGENGAGGSADVWNKMYELSEKGVYERKWLGDYDRDNIRSPLYTRMHAIDSDLFYGYNLNTYGTSEEGIQSFLEDHGRENQYSPREFGYFYAYRLANPSSINVIELFNAGDAAMKEMKNLGIEDPESVITDAASEFFGRRYDEP